jgi:hypothetical protein
MLIYGTIPINKQIWHISLEGDQRCNLNKDLIILTKPRKQYNNQTFMEVGMAYCGDLYLASRELVTS